MLQTEQEISRDRWINDVWITPKVKFSAETTLEMALPSKHSCNPYFSGQI